MVYQCKIIYLLNAAIKPFQYSLNGTDWSYIYYNITTNVRLHSSSNLRHGDIKIVTIQWQKDWCGWKFIMICHKVFASTINVFRSISVDFIFFLPKSSLELLQFPRMVVLRRNDVAASFRRNHDAVIKWKHIPRYWPFVRGIHRSPVNSPHKGQWREALGFSLICVWINGWVNNRAAGGAHYDVIVMEDVIIASFLCRDILQTLC